MIIDMQYPQSGKGESMVHDIKKIQLISLFLMGSLLPALACSTDADSDSTKVVASMNTLFAAMGKENMEQFHRITCPDFYIFDNGKLLAGNQVMDMVKKAHASGMSFVWQVTQPQVHVDGNTAWMTYVNQGAIINASGTKDMKWLESAVLNKTSNGWCIQFAHSTRVPPAK